MVSAVGAIPDTGTDGSDTKREFVCHCSNRANNRRASCYNLLIGAGQSNKPAGYRAPDSVQSQSLPHRA